MCPALGGETSVSVCCECVAKGVVVSVWYGVGVACVAKGVVVSVWYGVGVACVYRY
jgi:hypothetical protein